MNESNGADPDRLTAAEVTELNAVHIDLSPNRHVGVAELIDAWQFHLTKLRRDMSVPPDDRSAWGAHDLVAALILRDHLADGMSKLAPALQWRVRGAVAVIDEVYLRYSVPDDDGCLERVAELVALPDRWWWRRAPRSGPVYQELVRYYGHAPPS